MAIQNTSENFDVVLVGLGPVGATLAHLLGVLGVKTLVLEREPVAYHLPRAVHFDDEIMRVFQWIGIADELLPQLRINPGMRFVDPNGKLLLDWPRPREEGPLGWHPSWRFHQPDLEKVLRVRLAERDSVTMRTRCDVFMIEDKPEHVALRYEDMSTGRVNHIHAKYVVGCDGARSLVRRFIDTEMQDLGFHERWLVVDVLLNGEKPELGDHSIQYCNPARPATYVRSPGNRRRWEIAVLQDEDSNTIASETEVWKLLSDWLTPDEAVLERSAVYTFHSLIAKDWRRGRLLIAGDAAHQTPPFMGQGMCAGIRDAANLSWKLADVVQRRSGDQLLDSYQTEREPNSAEFINTAVRLGRLINAADSKGALRSAMQKPDGGAEIKSIYPPLGPGLGIGRNAGRQFGQPRMNDGRRMDDVTGFCPVIVADHTLVAGFKPPHGVRLITTQDTSYAATHLAAFNTAAVLLRPDRYILGSADTLEELIALLPLLSQKSQEKEMTKLMKLCSFHVENQSSYGIVTGAGIIDLGKRLPQKTLREYLAAGDMSPATALASAPADYAFDAVQHAPVIPNPDKIICVGLNYHDHIGETGREETPFPVLFARYSGSQIGHEQPLMKPLESDKFDYEGELAAIIGKECRRVSEADALSVVAGYACYNDASVRDWQKHTHQFMPGKTFYATGPFGPWMVTADEIPDPTTLRLQTRLNGDVMQDTTTDLMIASIPRLISYCSTILPLLPGDVIVSGTPGGVGARRTPPVFMKEGDVCEVEISSIGLLRNTVKSEG